MRHKFPVLTVKKLLKSVFIYGSYRKNKTGVPFFWNTLYSTSAMGRPLQHVAKEKVKASEVIAGIILNT